MISVSLRKQGMCHVIPQIATNLSRLPAKLPSKQSFPVSTENGCVREREKTIWEKRQKMNWSQREAWRLNLGC